MSEQDILQKKDLFKNFIERHRLHDAFALIRGLSERQMSWELTDEINRLESVYRYMVSYALDGADDPQRDAVYDDIVSSLAVVFDRLVRLAATPSNPTMYYSLLRDKKRETLGLIARRYLDSLASTDNFAKAMGNVDRTDVMKTEVLVRDMFGIIWTTFPLTDSNASVLEELLSSATVPYHAKRSVVAALSMSLISFFDDNVFKTLASVYAKADDPRLEMPALTGLCLGLYLNRNRRMSRKVTDIVASLRELPQWTSDLRTVFLELIRTRDTERITRKLRDEVVPGMMKMKPKIQKGFLTDIDLNDIEANPEWESLLNETGLADQLKELNELQQEGGDVMMGTFAHLKSFPFFYDMANWFLPFYPEHTALARSVEDYDALTELLDIAPVFCESDKYSFMFALCTAPPAQRKMMAQQLETQNIQQADLEQASLMLNPDRRRSVANRYIQDLYRFFNLFRRKDDFYNPFADEINLSAVDLLKGDLKQGDTLSLVAEFYFAHGYYAEALNVFKIIDENNLPQAQLYQKMGYCEQKLGNLNEALRYYEQAEMLDSNSRWTLRRLAGVLRALGQPKRALQYYKRLDELEPEKFATLLALGESSLAIGKYDAALDYLYKAQWLKPESNRTLRPLAWTLTMLGKHDKARELYDRILADNPTADDYMNLGHLYLLCGDTRQAVNEYKTAVLASADGIAWFRDAYKADFDELAKAGISPSTLDLVSDAVLYSLDNK